MKRFITGRKEKREIHVRQSRRARAAAAAAEPAAAAAAAEPATKSAQSRRALREATARAVRAHSVTQPFRSQPVPAGRSSNAGLGWSGISGARPETPRACAMPSRDHVMTDRSRCRNAARSLTHRCTDPSRSSQLSFGAGVAGSACCA